MNYYNDHKTILHVPLHDRFLAVCWLLARRYNRFCRIRKAAGTRYHNCGGGYNPASYQNNWLSIFIIKLRKIAASRYHGCQCSIIAFMLIFSLKSLRSPSSAFNILDFVSFCNSSCTRSSRSYKLSHSCSSTLSSHFYFARLPRIWNSLPSIDPLNLPLSSVISHIKSYFWSYLLITSTHLSYVLFTSPVLVLTVFIHFLTHLTLL